MFLHRTAIVSACALVGLMSASAGAVSVVQVLTPAQMNAGDATMTVQRAAVCEGTTSYHFIAKTGGLAMNKVTGVGTSPSASTITTLASWTADVGAPSNSRVFTGFGMAIIGNDIQIVDTENDSVFRLNKNTGAVSVYVPKATISAFVGGTANVNNSNGFSPTGEAVFYEGLSQSILQTTAGGGLSTLVTAAELVAAQGAGNTSVSSGITYDGSGNAYWAENNSDKVYKRASDGSISSILGPTELSPLIGAAVTYSGDVFYAPDGWMYMRAGASASTQNIMKFDPANPSGTVQILVPSADLIAAMGNTAVLQMSWFNNNLAFTNSALGYYGVVPEPASLMLIGLGGVALLRRRHA